MCPLGSIPFGILFMFMELKLFDTCGDQMLTGEKGGVKFGELLKVIEL